MRKERHRITENPLPHFRKERKGVEVENLRERG
jgi:hypothetical protein